MYVSQYYWKKPELWGIGMAVAMAGPYANNSHHTPDANTFSHNFYGPHALPDAQPTASKH